MPVDLFVQVCTPSFQARRFELPYRPVRRIYPIPHSSVLQKPSEAPALSGLEVVSPPAPQDGTQAA